MEVALTRRSRNEFLQRNDGNEYRAKLENTSSNLYHANRARNRFEIILTANSCSGELDRAFSDRRIYFIRNYFIYFDAKQ